MSAHPDQTCIVYVPNGEPHSWVDQKFGMADEGACHRQKCSHFSQSKLYAADDKAHHSVAQQSAERSCSLN